MRVVLVNPPPSSSLERHWARFPLLGLAYLAASLRQNGHDVLILDGKLGGLTQEQICGAAVEHEPDLVGITCMTVDYPMAVRIASAVKARSDVPIVLGGAHVNAVGTQALEEGPCFDFACLGEGEFLVNELVACIASRQSVRRVRGLVYRCEGRIVSNGSRPYPDDYDVLPFPAWDLFAPVDQIPILTHRGCPFRCNFCSHNSGFKPRFRSPANVLEEIGSVLDRYRPKIVRFEDETFGLHVERTKRILEGIIERGYHRRTQFSAQTRVDRIDENLVDLLREANFQTLELGVESGNAALLAQSGKQITLEQAERAVALAKSRGLRVWCKFILGHPHESRLTIRDTADWIARVNPDRLSVAIMTPFPGTPIHAMAAGGEGGYRLVGASWRAFDKYAPGVLELQDVSLTELRGWQLWCYLNMYAKNRRIHEAASLVFGHPGVVMGMVLGLLAQIVRDHTRRWNPQ